MADSELNDRRGVQNELNDAVISYHSPRNLYTHLSQNQTWTPNLTFSPDGKSFATLAIDRKVRIFATVTGKLKKVIDESLKQVRRESY